MKLTIPFVDRLLDLEIPAANLIFDVAPRDVPPVTGLTANFSPIPRASRLSRCHSRRDHVAHGVKRFWHSADRTKVPRRPAVEVLGL